MDGEKAYNLSVEKAAESLGASLESGLGAAEAKKRLSEFGPNQLQEKKGIGPLEIFVRQFKDFIVLILVGAALVS